MRIWGWNWRLLKVLKLGEYSELREESCDTSDRAPQGEQQWQVCHYDYWASIFWFLSWQFFQINMKWKWQPNNTSDRAHHREQQWQVCHYDNCARHADFYFLCNCFLQFLSLQLFQINMKTKWQSNDTYNRILQR